MVGDARRGTGEVVALLVVPAETGGLQHRLVLQQVQYRVLKVVCVISIQKHYLPLVYSCIYKYELYLRTTRL